MTNHVAIAACLLAMVACSGPDLPHEVAPHAWNAARESAKVVRVHVIGASVSGGFRDGPLFRGAEAGDTLPLHMLLRKWAGDRATVTTRSAVLMMAMFQNAERIGRMQIDDALRIGPDLVVAVDFPFWFAYGHVGANEAEERKARFATGLAMMEKLTMPVLVGDLPDMRGAAQRMLSPNQIPSPDVLNALNTRLAEFVKAHPNFRPVPLAKLVKTMKVDGAALPLAKGSLQTPPGALLQGDHLHATRLGMAFLGFSIQDTLRAAFPKDHPLHEQKWTFEQFVEAAGAEDELDALCAKSAERAAGK